MLTYDYYEIALKEALRPAITYAVNDLKDPNARKSDFSKTITLPSSKQLDKLFNHVFNINVATNTFNPNKRLDVSYLADEEVQINGYLKLDEVVINDYNKVEYKVSIFGKSADLFSNIGEKELTDIDLTEYNHDWSFGIQELSWATSVQRNGSGIAFAKGTGYVYPLIEYGIDANTNDYKTIEMFPAVYAKEYIDRIFSDAGKSYSSSFFSSSLFKSLIIPYNGTGMNKTQAQINNLLFGADSATGTVTATVTPSIVIFPTEVSDVGGNYNNATGVFTAPTA